jgi:hypothetical protein
MMVPFYCIQLLLLLLGNVDQSRGNSGNGLPCTMKQYKHEITLSYWILSMETTMSNNIVSNKRQNTTWSLTANLQHLHCLAILLVVTSKKKKEGALLSIFT